MSSISSHTSPVSSSSLSSPSLPCFSALGTFQATSLMSHATHVGTTPTYALQRTSPFSSCRLPASAGAGHVECKRTYRSFDTLAARCGACDRGGVSALTVADMPIQFRAQQVCGISRGCLHPPLYEYKIRPFRKSMADRFDWWSDTSASLYLLLERGHEHSHDPLTVRGDRSELPERDRSSRPPSSSRPACVPPACRTAVPHRHAYPQASAPCCLPRG
jgi:hypothetical protein